MFSTGTGDEQRGLEGPIVSGARCMVAGGTELCLGPQDKVYAKHLNCPFIIVSDFSSVLARFLPMSYPALPFNPLNPLFLPHFPQMKATFLKDFFF